MEKSAPNNIEDYKARIIEPTNASDNFGKTNVPSAINQREFRKALGQFATGVTIVTTNTEHGPIGMTVNSFASVSLDPALVLWSVSNRSARHDAFCRAKYFAIHVLHEGQSDLALNFAKNPNAFDEYNWRYGNKKLPILSSMLARFECELETSHAAGDHTIIIGKVSEFLHHEGKPLIFSGGNFGKFFN